MFHLQFWKALSALASARCGAHVSLLTLIWDWDKDAANQRVLKRPAGAEGDRP